MNPTLEHRTVADVDGDTVDDDGLTSGEAGILVCELRIHPGSRGELVGFFSESESIYKLKNTSSAIVHIMLNNVYFTSRHK